MTFNSLRIGVSIPLLVCAVSFTLTALMMGAHALSTHSFSLTSHASSSQNSGVFSYTFNSPGTLNEAANALESSSPYWFLDSGGELLIENGKGNTIQGALPPDALWHTRYASSNPIDTDNGTHPQNIFRLLSKQAWQNVSIEASFTIAADNLSLSPNRNESNGIFLMSRYQDHDTLYYAGIRVDGTAVIKKKYHGTYYTMAQVPLFGGSYDAQSHPDLLPHHAPIALKSESVNEENGAVRVQLSVKEPGETTWKIAVSAEDTGAFGKTPPIVDAGVVGIRTDFMDVSFNDLKIASL